MPTKLDSCTKNPKEYLLKQRVLNFARALGIGAPIVDIIHLTQFTRSMMWQCVRSFVNQVMKLI